MKTCMKCESKILLLFFWLAFNDVKFSHDELLQRC